MSNTDFRSTPVGDVTHHPKNARVHDLEAIKASLSRFGQTKPIIVQTSTGHVVAGNGTLKAAKDLGWTEVNAVFVDMSDADAEAYLAADNRTSDRAQYESDKLLELLSGLEDLEGTGFDEKYVGALGQMVASPPAKSGAGPAATVTEEQKAEYEEKKKTRKKPERAAEPFREVVMLLPVSVAQEFGEQVNAIKTHRKLGTFADTVRAIIGEAFSNLPEKS